jgi:hypothetical protein
MFTVPYASRKVYQVARQIDGPQGSDYAHGMVATFVVS